MQHDTRANVFGNCNCLDSTTLQQRSWTDYWRDYVNCCRLQWIGVYMTWRKREIMEMAREAGGCLTELPNGDAWVFSGDLELEAFTKLVREDERERIKEENQRCYVARGQA
jgi:hypothetical protein